MTDVVYLDNAATTPVRPDVLDAMMPYLTDETFGNPSSAHRFGQAARAGIERARRQIAGALGAEPGEVVFTSGGTEADNLAVLGAALAGRDRGGAFAVAVGAAEHKAVIAAAHAVEAMGGTARFLPVDARGQVEAGAVDDALAGRPAVLSLMWVNNEVGILQDVQSLAERCHDAGVAFHTDAVQAVGKVPTRLGDTRWTLLTLSGHKIGAPKGVGALVVRDKSAVAPLIHGGGQQSGIRPGTENVAGIVGLGEAVTLAVAEVDQAAHRLAGLRDAFENRVREAVPGVTVIGADAPRAPHISALAFPGIDPQALLAQCDQAGVACSTGSACNTGLPEPSHVLQAMGLPRGITTSMVRFSFFKQNTEADVNRVVDVLPGLVAKARQVAAALGG